MIFQSILLPNFILNVRDLIVLHFLSKVDIDDNAPLELFLATVIQVYLEVVF